MKTLSSLAQKYFVDAIIIIVVLFGIGFFFVDRSGGWYYSNGLMVMTNQEVRLNTNDMADVISLNIKIRNFSKTPVILKSEFAKIAANILKGRPSKEIHMLYEDDETFQYAPLTFYVIENEEYISIFIPSREPLQGTVGALYFAAFRLTDKSEFKDSYSQAQAMSYLWVSAKKNLSYSEYKVASGDFLLTNLDEIRYENIRKGMSFSAVPVK